MSDYESHSGKLRIVEAKENENFEQLCKRLWIEESQKDDEFEEKFVEENYEEGSLFEDYKKYFDVNGKVWEVVEHKELGDEDDMFCKIHDNKDGTLSFHTRFYNGGTCLSEMGIEALEKLDVNESK